MDKKQIFDEILRELKREFATMVQSAMSAKEAATHEEAVAEDKYDTRGLEASYLAQGQAIRAQVIRQAITVFEKIELKKFDGDSPIASTALVELDHEGKSVWYFLLPDRGGIHVDVGAKRVTTLSPESPLGQLLVNKKVGDEIYHQTPSGEREFSILSVR